MTYVCFERFSIWDRLYGLLCLVMAKFWQFAAYCDKADDLIGLIIGTN